eukprot:scaffold22589_cov138-Cylindrotheca_fusiformis.AAC.26
MPLTFEPLEQAIALKKSGSQNASKFQSRKHDRDDASDFYAESSYLLVSNSRGSGSKISDQEQQRTGRWTEEEIAYVDFLVTAFDKGRLPLPHGIKLNEFLGDVLLCKSSRLTKKMKNAKLSTRSFVLSRPDSTSVRSDCAVLSGLQEKFLMSISSKSTQLELRFNMTKQWRTHFSNLCVQVGYQFLDGKDWVSSLEEMERRASLVEDNVRKVRRRKMSVALQTDGGSSANPSVFISGIKADTASSQLEPLSFNTEVPKRSRLLSAGDDADFPKRSRFLSVGDDADVSDDLFPMLSTSLSSGVSPLLQSQAAPRSRTFSEDFDAVLNDLIGPEQDVPSAQQVQQDQGPSSRSSSPSHSPCGPFLDAVVAYMESNNLPFQHVDVWVPSFLPRNPDKASKAVDMEQLRLFHAGSSTRGDLDGPLAYALNEFGVYSENFSFEPGHGLPGRVYSSGRPSWETYVHESDPAKFERAGGAKIYGVKTAFGVPLKTPLVGTIVVILYSCNILNENFNLAQECYAELVKLSPEPKWKIVIDTNDSSNAPDKAGKHNSPLATSAQLSHIPQRRNSASVGDSLSVAMKGEDEEQRIVSLLGEHMPLNESTTGELLPHFMAMRLTLLRPSNRRSPQENEMIEILKNSFRAYSKDNRRSGSDLAKLLAKDWVCLKSSFGSSVLPAQAQRQSPLNQPRRGSLSAPSPPMMPPRVRSSGSPMSENQGQSIVSYDHSLPNRRGSSVSEHSQMAHRMSFSESSTSSTGMVKPMAIRSANLSVPNEPPVVTPNVISEN